MKKFAVLVLILALVILASSCKGKEANTEHQGENQTAQTENNTDEMDSTVPSETIQAQPTFEQLCDKLVSEMKAMGTPEAALEQTRAGCMQAQQTYQGKVAQAEAFVGHILDSCEGKSGQDWFNCYNAEAQNAAQKAAAVMGGNTEAATEMHTEANADSPANAEMAKTPSEPSKVETETSSKYTYNALCDKLANEMKGMGTPDSAIEQARQGCKQGGAAFAQNQQMMEKYVKHVMTACEGKSGQEWFMCYSSEAQVAAQKMAGGM